MEDKPPAPVPPDAHAPPLTSQETELPLLASVQLLARVMPAIGALPHVLELLDELLDYSRSWAIPKACRTGSVSLLRRLAKREELFPDAWTKDEPLFRAWQFSRGTIEAARHGHLNVIEWLVTEYDRQTMIARAVSEAARHGHLHILKWMYKNCFHRTYFGVTEMRQAARKNHLEVLQWLYQHTFMPKHLCLMDEATRHGNMEMIYWLRTIPGECTMQSMLNAVSMGKLEIVQYLQHFCFSNIGHVFLDSAASRGHLDILQWLHARGASCSPNTVTGAAGNGHLEVVIWLHENQVKVYDAYKTDTAGELWTVAVMDKAASNGHLALVQWLHDNRTEGCTSAAMDGAATSGHLEVVEWLHKNRTEGCTTKAMDGAASNGHLDIVQFLHAHRGEGCTAEAMDTAAKENHMEVVLWFHENRSEGCTTAAMDGAAGGGHLEMVQWLHENRSEGCTTGAMDSAAAGGHLQVVKWLHATRMEGCTVGAMDGAAMSAHFEVIKWLHDFRIEGCSSAAIDNAAGTGRLDIIRWLDDTYAPGCSSRAIERASLRGYFHIMLYLMHKQMAPLTPDVTARAVYQSNLEILEWAFRDHRSKVDARLVYRKARDYDRYSVEWLHRRGITFLDPW